MTVVSIHQPEFMPWMGFFHKMLRSDTFIILDHVQFKKRYFENRNRIVTPRGEVLWLGVPIMNKGRYAQSISDVEILDDGRWRKKFLERVRHAYSKAPCYDLVMPGLESIVNGGHARLMDLNLDLIRFFMSHLGIGTPLLFSSQMDVADQKGSGLILALCERLHARTYLCGAHGKDYLAEEDFRRSGIVIEYLNYQPPSYPQLCPEHVSHLSVLDLLCNTGPDAGSILARQNGGTP